MENVGQPLQTRHEPAGFDLLKVKNLETLEQGVKYFQS